MPKPRFNIIAEEKRKRFLDASIYEFTTKPFDKVSVNTIIKRANISRGAFYTYFDSLDELFKYIFRHSIKEERLSHTKEVFNVVNGDIFKFIKLIFQYDYNQFSKQGRYSLFRNYIHYIQHFENGSIIDYFKELMLSNFPGATNLKTVFDYESLGLSYEDFIDLVEMIIILMVNTFLKAEKDKLSKDDVVKLFNKRLSYIEYGLKKEGHK